MDSAAALSLGQRFELERMNAPSMPKWIQRARHCQATPAGLAKPTRGLRWLLSQQSDQQI